MKKLILFGLLALLGIRCKSLPDVMATPESCFSDRPTLTGKWVMTEFRYFGGCCPAITDVTWKKAPENAYILEFSTDGKVKVANSLSGNNGVIPALPAQLSTNFTYNGSDILLDEQIFGGALWEKQTKVIKLTTQELILSIVVGKEGETNERKFVRSCQ